MRVAEGHGVVGRDDRRSLDRSSRNPRPVTRPEILHAHPIALPVAHHEPQVAPRHGGIADHQFAARIPTHDERAGTIESNDASMRNVDHLELDPAGLLRSGARRYRSAIVPAHGKATAPGLGERSDQPVIGHATGAEVQVAAGRSQPRLDQRCDQVRRRRIVTVLHCEVEPPRLVRPVRRPQRHDAQRGQNRLHGAYSPSSGSSSRRSMSVTVPDAIAASSSTRRASRRSSPAELPSSDTCFNPNRDRQ